ncbi:ATP synthase F1, delta subunit, partial [human gut metagenome]
MISAPHTEKSLPKKKEEFVVTLSYVTAPTDEQLQNIRNFIQKKYNREDMVFETKEDPSLGGGFIIR